MLAENFKSETGYAFHSVHTAEAEATTTYISTYSTCLAFTLLLLKLDPNLPQAFHRSGETPTFYYDHHHQRIMMMMFTHL